MKLTIDQEKAVKTRGGKIVIGAAAGSGKTAVLSARVINYIMNGGSIKDLLIVTFTTLAASEMKERIKNNIFNALSNEKDNKHLKKEIVLIEDANIMTMDSFYNKLIKDNFYRLNIKPNFSIIDEVELSVLEKKVITNLVEDELKEKKPEFINLLDNFNNPRNNETIENLVINFNRFINEMPFSEQWLLELEKTYRIDDFNDGIWSEILYRDLKINLQSYLTLYEEVLLEAKLDDTLLDKLFPFFNSEKAKINKIFNAVNKKEHSELVKLIDSFNYGRFPIIRGYKDNEVVVKAKNIRTSFRAVLDDYRNNVELYKQEEFINSLKNMYPLIKELSRITVLYRKKLKNELDSRNVLTFTSIPQLLLELLIDDYNHYTGEYTKSVYAKTLEELYEEILIDEYQDTNLLQDLLFKAISKNEENLFIVGDVKQSIYGFRSARPELLNNEKSRADELSFPMLINLSKNFRSRDYIINFTNYLFTKIMNIDFGNMEYDEKEKLNLGALFADNDEAIIEVAIISGEEDEVETEELDLSKSEVEAKYITNRIHELMDSNYQVYDNKLQMFRKLKFSDIAILLRNNLNEPYVKALTKSGIPVYTESAPIYFDNYEVRLIISLLELIDNPYNEIALVAVLRSPLFMFELDDLLEIRMLDKDSNLYFNIQKLNNEKINKFLNKLKEYRDKASELPIDQLLVHLYNDTDIITILSINDYGDQIIKNILEMIKHAETFKKNENHSLHDFINYLNELIDSKVNLEGVNPSVDHDSVLITTIHKSKGLEFPIVFLPNLDKQFNLKSLRDNIVMDLDYYLSFKTRNYEDYSTVNNALLELMKKHKLQKLLEEELRILYVALTRAKEKLILSGTVNKLETKINKVASLIGNDEKILPSYLLASRSFLDWILPIILRSYKPNILHDYTNINLKKYNDETEFKVEVIAPHSLEDKYQYFSNLLTEIDLDKMKDILEFALPVLPKYKENMSVTEINSTTFFKEPKFVNASYGTTVGTIYHKIVEHLSLKKYNKESFKVELEALINKKIVTEEEINLIDTNKIYGYLNTDIYNNIVLQGEVYQEYEISFFLPAEFVLKEDVEGEILVDGIIDLLCIFEDKAVIIDFKSDVGSEQELIDRYHKQLDMYEHHLKKEYKQVDKYIYSFYLDRFILL